MRFLVEAQLPPALAPWVTAQGHIAGHVATALTTYEWDAAIVQYPIDNGAVIISKIDRLMSFEHEEGVFGVEGLLA